MNGWVRADIHYGLPMARLYVTAEEYRAGSLAEQVHRNLEAMGNDPAAMGAFFAGLIQQFRPELVGGSLVAVRFDFERACWEFLYCHPRLPRVPSGCELERIPLVPSDAGDQPAAGALTDADRSAIKKSILNWRNTVPAGTPRGVPTDGATTTAVTVVDTLPALRRATAEDIGDVLVDDCGRVYASSADPDAPHVVAGGES